MINLYYCGHEITDEDFHGPYIYQYGGVGAPHVCMRCNRKGYLFAIDEKDVPAWFEGDDNIKFISALEDTSVINKVVINNELKKDLGFTTAVIGTSLTAKNTFSKILTRQIPNFDVSVIKKIISEGRRVFINIENDLVKSG